ncbi:MAG: hypothetical protein ACFB0G_16165 [Leptolyngbyaceae cyanobacterium]
MKTLPFAFMLTAYCSVSFALFAIISNTLMGGLVYLFLLLPIYGLSVLAGWIFVWQYWGKTVQIKRRYWSVVLALQTLTCLTSPGNCFGVKQGDRCYSNLQILVGQASRSGMNTAPHWPLVEDAFYGLAIAYSIALIVSLVKTLTVKE